MKHAIRLFSFSVAVVLCSRDFDKDVYGLAKTIALAYFRKFRCVTYITDRPENHARILAETGKPLLVVDEVHLGNSTGWDRDAFFVRIYETGCMGMVVHVDGKKRPKIVKELLEGYKKSDVYRYNRHRYLFLPVDEKDQEFEEVLAMKEMYYMPNFLIVSADETDGYRITTHNYFNGYRYEVLGITHDVLDTWSPSDGFKKGVDLYPDKLTNLMGKKLTFALLNYDPYTFVIKNEDGMVFDGLETRLAATYVEMYNGTWDAVDNPEFAWGTLFENGSGNGILGVVREHSADMGFAAVYQWHCDELACSYPYVFAGVTCMVPRPQQLPGWMTIIIPFTKTMWLAIFSAYLINSSFVFVLSRIERIGKRPFWGERMPLFDAFYNTFRLQLAEQIPKMVHGRGPVSSYLRVLTIYYFLLAVCWSASVASILTVPRQESPINTVKDLTSRYPKLRWGGTHIDWTLSIKQATEPMIKMIVDKFEVLEEAQLQKRTKTRDFAFFMERLNNGHYGFNSYINEESLEYLKVMEKNIYTANCITVMPRGCPYHEKLDKAILLMLDTGLVQKIEIQVSLERSNNRLHNLIRISNEKPADRATSLQVKHIQGPVIIFCGGTIFSLLVFLLELFTHRGAARKSRKKTRTFSIGDIVVTSLNT